MNNKNWLKEISMKDLGWKVLSILIAVSLWFVVINIQNPEDNKTISGIPVEIRNLQMVADNNQKITNIEDLEKTIFVKIKGQRLALENLAQNKGLIKAYIDFDEISWIPENNEVVPIQIRFEVPSGFEVMDRDRQKIYLTYENLTYADFNVLPNYIGDVSANYIRENAEFNPSLVRISGTQNLVESIVKVIADIPLEDLKTNSAFNEVPVKAINANGEMVQGVHIAPNNVDIFLPVKGSKLVPVVISEPIGVLQEGYVLENIEINPEFVHVIGEEEALNNLAQIELPAPNLTGRNEDIENIFYINRLLPAGTILQSGEPDKITVNATVVEEATKKVVLKEKDISVKIDLAEELVAEVRLEDYTLQIKGLSSDLDNLNAEDISGALLIENLDEGEYVLDIDVVVPKGVRLDSNSAPSATVIIRNSLNDANETD